MASLQGPVVEGLIRQSVEIDPPRPKDHRRVETLAGTGLRRPARRDRIRQIETITGIGKLTAAALVAKIVQIDRFATPESVVSYFGIFPEENTSGMDKFGRPVPPGTMSMSRQGKRPGSAVLVERGEVRHHPQPGHPRVVRPATALGKRGDVALGHCMRKLLHLVFAIWKTDEPFAPREAETDDESPTPTVEAQGAQGRKGRRRERQAVTQAASNIPQPAPASNAPGAASATPASAHPIERGQGNRWKIRGF